MLIFGGVVTGAWRVGVGFWGNFGDEGGRLNALNWFTGAGRTIGAGRRMCPFPPRGTCART